MMYAHYGKSKKQVASIFEIDGKRFLKLCKESKIVNKKFNGNACDLLFTSLARPKKTISFETFTAKALPALAAKVGTSVDVLKAKITSGGPKSSGTKAQYNKFHDDKSTWTATAVAGGPTTIDNAITLSNLADRTAADVRGVKY